MLTEQASYTTAIVDYTYDNIHMHVLWKYKETINKT